MAAITMNRRVATAAAALSAYCLISACSTSPVVSTGPQTYSLSATRCGLCIPVTSYVTQQANQYCDSRGEQVSVRGITSNNLQPMFPGSATISFTCVALSAAAPLQQVADECTKGYETATLDSIRHKIELYRSDADAAPAFEMAANENYPTATERAAIAEWATLRDACMARQRAALHVPPGASPIQATFIEQDAAFGDETGAKVSALIVALYQGKLRYGEFAQKRYEIDRDGADAERAFRQAALIADEQRAEQAEQLAQQKFQNRLLAWSAYLQTVNARPSQTTIQVQQNVMVH